MVAPEVAWVSDPHSSQLAPHDLHVPPVNMRDPDAHLVHLEAPEVAWVRDPHSSQSVPHGMHVPPVDSRVRTSHRVQTLRSDGHSVQFSSAHATHLPAAESRK
jgi:hypothetical protein